ncbi:uncharacterized protein si:ch211-14k19.8 [Callorhinchus milii]|uniref:uncharacterized protein si:ch211-14k19.8 n=1 Tax=Callorhinchus milii TaxID=7868 RepID=UPI001C3FAD8C|nr:uncharacterized protein si:ch211-14k19.8 [Callorhinchus milii]
MGRRACEQITCLLLDRELERRRQRPGLPEQRRNVRDREQYLTNRDRNTGNRERNLAVRERTFADRHCDVGHRDRNVRDRDQSFTADGNVGKREGNIGDRDRDFPNGDQNIADRNPKIKTTDRNVRDRDTGDRDRNVRDRDTGDRDRNVRDRDTGDRDRNVRDRDTGDRDRNVRDRDTGDRDRNVRDRDPTLTDRHRDTVDGGQYVGDRECNVADGHRNHRDRDWKIRDRDGNVVDRDGNVGDGDGNVRDRAQTVTNRDATDMDRNWNGGDRDRDFPNRDRKDVDRDRNVEAKGCNVANSAPDTRDSDRYLGGGCGCHRAGAPVSSRTQGHSHRHHGDRDTREAERRRHGDTGRPGARAGGGGSARGAARQCVCGCTCGAAPGQAAVSHFGEFSIRKAAERAHGHGHPFYQTFPGFIELQIQQIRRGSVVIEYSAVFWGWGLGALLSDAGRLLEVTGLRRAVRRGLSLAGVRVLRVYIPERGLDLCGTLFSCPPGFSCVHTEAGNVTCTSLCHQLYCKNSGICSHSHQQLPLCRCPVGSDYWYMGSRCDHRMTQQSLTGIVCGVVLAVAVLLGAGTIAALRRVKNLLTEARTDQTQSSYRRFSRFDDLSVHDWSRSWLNSTSSLDNPVFSRSDEFLHLHMLDSSYYSGLDPFSSGLHPPTDTVCGRSWTSVTGA